MKYHDLQMKNHHLRMILLYILMVKSPPFAGPRAPACRAPASAPLGTRFLGDGAVLRDAGSPGVTGGATKKW